MAVAFDPAGSASRGDTAPAADTQVILNHPAGASVTLLTVFVSWRNTTTRTVNSVTWDAAGTPIPLFQVSGALVRNGNNRNIDAWYANNIPNATKDITIVMSGAISDIISTSATWTGTATDSTAIGTPVFAVGNSGTASCSIAWAAGEMITDCLACASAPTMVAHSTRTNANMATVLQASLRCGRSRQASDNPATCDWTFSSEVWAVCALCLKPPAAATGHPTMRRWGGTPYMPPSQPRRGKGWL